MTQFHVVRTGEVMVKVHTNILTSTLSYYKLGQQESNLGFQLLELPTYTT